MFLLMAPDATDYEIIFNLYSHIQYIVLDIVAYPKFSFKITGTSKAITVFLIENWIPDPIIRPIG